MANSFPQGSGTWKVALLLAVLILLAATLLLAGERGHRPANLGFWGILLFPRYWMAAIFAAMGLTLLIKRRVSRNLRLAFLPIIFFVFAVIYALPWGWFAGRMGQHPSPVCMLTKPFLYFQAGRAVPLIFWVSLLVVAVLSLVGNKLFCGWVCPIGALQELVNRIPLPRGLKVKAPFKLTNSIRIMAFALFLIVVFTAGFEIYEYFNPFEFLHWRFEPLAIGIIIGTMVVSLFIWRPFCYFLCPLGLLTWLFEQVSFFKVKVDRSVCKDCDKCIRESPCLAISSIVAEKKIRPDCFACGLCFDSCNKGALHFKK
ncbi:MAG: 4Fe-4S binding protein [Candidatus Krumholzibacteria bacterium]|nr:4Fe-4S binding protein [Candidatus Krumholzibacteria bacterium]